METAKVLDACQGPIVGNFRHQSIIVPNNIHKIQIDRRLAHFLPLLLVGKQLYRGEYLLYLHGYQSRQVEYWVEKFRAREFCRY